MTTDFQTRVETFLRDVTRALGLSLTIASARTPDGWRFDLEGDGGELLARRKGEVLDSLQQIVNAVFRRDLPDGGHVLVDCMGVRKGKDAELREMAKFLAGKARETGTPQEMGPLNPYARRIVHLAVAEDPAFCSESIGDAFMKTVVISTRK